MGEPHEMRIRVRYSETDQMGVVHHASYLIYLEEGRTALMRTLGFPYDDVERRGFGMAVRKLDVRYRQAARYGDEVLVRTRIERYRSASIVYANEIVRVADEAPILEAFVEVACLDLGEAKPVPLPDDIRTAIEGYFAGS